MPIMPFTTDSVTREVIWRYLPDEILDENAFADVRSLVIMSDYQLPQLEPFFNGLVHTLKILNMDVANLPERIPDSVRTLIFHRTTIADLGQLVSVNWYNIQLLVLSSNHLLNGKSLIVPEGIVELKIISQNLRDIRFMGNPADTTNHVRKLVTEYGSFEKLTGHLPRNQILLFSTTRSIYTQPTHEIMRDYQRELLRVPSTRHRLLMNKRDKDILECIARMNVEMGYSLYEDFGSIPKRIRVSEANMENPIVVAMNLSSNYPRRMAEFLNEK